MAVIPEQVADLVDEMTAWRHELHGHPELAWEEHRTAAFIADRLREFGLEVETGIGGTGVVGTLHAGEGPSLALRAEMDALPIQEESDVPWASTVPGVMHACGHDGHCAMVLGAARLLSGTAALSGNSGFSGTVRFVFQPAEENEAGARAMIEDGLFDRFPVDAAFALHNEPGMEVGSFAVRPGPVMASLDLFEIVVEGRPGHAARRGVGGDAVSCAARIAGEVATVHEELLVPSDRGVIRVTEIRGGHSWNVLPESVTLRGTARSFRPETRDEVEGRVHDLVERAAEEAGCTARVVYDRRYPATINSVDESSAASAAALAVAGAERVVTDLPALTAAEDFAFMLERRPGCYTLLGNGASAPVHTPAYDFADGALGWGTSYWVTLVENVFSGRYALARDRPVRGR